MFLKHSQLVNLTKNKKEKLIVVCNLKDLADPTVSWFVFVGLFLDRHRFSFLLSQYGLLSCTEGDSGRLLWQVAMLLVRTLS